MSRECSPCIESNCECSKQTLETKLSSNSNYEVVVHDDHLDLVMNGSLHHPHADHFDNHGIYDPSVNPPTKIYVQSIRALLYVFRIG